MLHHVSLEIHPDHAERSLEFFRLLGFQEVRAPDQIAEYVTWVERDGTQVHFIITPEPTTPPLGHPAFAVADFDATVSALRDAGFEVEDADELWGEPRAFAILPGGGRAEVMAAPPPASA